jgi:predicted RNA methylase
MRYFVPLLTACSGLAVAIACVAQSASFASAVEPSASFTKVAAARQNMAMTDNSARQVVCSRNRVSQLKGPDNTVFANVPEGLSLTSNIVELFCRDVRINTIVVRDYCAVIRH